MAGSTPTGEAEAGGPPGPADETARAGRRRRRRYAHSLRRTPSWPRRVTAVVGCLCIVAGLVLAGNVYLFYRHSDTVGSALIHQEQRSAGGVRASGRCVDALPGAGGATGTTNPLPVPDPAASPTGQSGTAPSGTSQVYALLKATSIGLVAPIVQGIDDPELDVAVGHVPASSWPGTTGTSVLAAHDVTWFSRIDELTPGDELSVVTACTTYLYTVDSHQVVQAGSVIDESATPRLVLTTCYPTDALFLTSQRYVLYASLTRVLRSGGPTTPGTATPAPAPVVPAPAALVAQGLDLEHNPAPLGSLTVTGSPTASWQQSSSPLDDESAVLQLYFAALRSASQDQPTWWADVAPGVPFAQASALIGSEVTYNAMTFSPSLTVTGDTFVGATLTTKPVLAGNADPGQYLVDFQAGVVNDQLVVTGWTMTRL